MRFAVAGQINGWTFYAVTEHGFTGELEGRALYGFGDGTQHNGGTRDGEPKIGELYGSLDHALVGAVAEKHTGRRGAGGTGVGTAADWFMRMIGAGQIQEAGPEGGRVLLAIVAEDVTASPGTARRIEKGLEKHGLVIARAAID
jgi:hypothetical protein